jgi:hypothetical protein
MAFPPLMKPGNVSGLIALRRNIEINSSDLRSNKNSSAIMVLIEKVKILRYYVGKYRR